jgi:hypothetical protein
VNVLGVEVYNTGKVTIPDLGYVIVNANKHLFDAEAGVLFSI